MVTLGSCVSAGERVLVQWVGRKQELGSGNDEYVCL